MAVSLSAMGMSVEKIAKAAKVLSEDGCLETPDEVPSGGTISVCLLPDGRQMRTSAGAPDSPRPRKEGRERAAF